MSKDGEFYHPKPPTNRYRVEPIDVETVRATVDIEPLPPPKMGRPPAVTQTRTVTTTSGSDEDFVEYMKPHVKGLFDEMLALAHDKSIKPQFRAQIINSIIDRVYGKPTQRSVTESTVADLTSLHLDALRNASK